MYQGIFFSVLSGNIPADTRLANGAELEGERAVYPLHIPGVDNL